MPKIDDAEYRAGREDFAGGRSLRTLVDPIVVDDAVFDEDREAREFSRLIGFFDALVDHLRKPLCVVNSESIDK